MINKFAAVVLCLALLGCTKRGEQKQVWAKPIIGEKAPDLVVEKWLTPAPDTKGKFVLVDFWATWCPPCLMAVPDLNHFQEKFRDKLVVIGLSDETEDNVRRLKQPVMNYSVAIDTQARMKRSLEVTGIPHVIIIDPQGIVRWEGLPSLRGYELTDNVIQDLLDKYGK